MAVLHGLLAAHGRAAAAGGHEVALLAVAEALARPARSPRHLLPHLPRVAVLPLRVLPAGVSCNIKKKDI